MGDVAGGVKGIESADGSHSAREQAAAPGVRRRHRLAAVEFADGVAAVVEVVGRAAADALPGTHPAAVIGNGYVYLVKTV